MTSNDTPAMTRTLVRFGAALITMSLLLSTFGCSDSPIGTDAPRPAALWLGAPVTFLHSLGETSTVGVTVVDERGDPLTGVPLSWSVDREDVVELGASGALTALANGEAWVTVRLPGSPTGPGGGSVVGPLEVAHRVVVEQRPTGLAIHGPGGRLDPEAGLAFHWLGETLPATATLVDGRDHPIPGSASGIAWEITDPAVLERDDAGRLVARSHGATTLRVHAGSWSTSVPVAVRSRLWLDWCVRYQADRPDAPEGGFHRCEPVELLFERDGDTGA